MLKIVPVPAFKDNYLWILHGSRHASPSGRKRARIAYYRPGDERAINPFPRCGERAEIAAATAPRGERPNDPVQALAAIREWKNRF